MKLTAQERKALKDNQFALPGRRYPIQDKAHAEAAKARADEMYKRGYLTRDEHTVILQKANAVIAKG